MTSSALSRVVCVVHGDHSFVFVSSSCFAPLLSLDGHYSAGLVGALLSLPNKVREHASLGPLWQGGPKPCSTLAGLATTAVSGLRAAGNQTDVSPPAGPVLQPKAFARRMTRSFAGAVYGSPEAEVLAKPVKKGLSAGTAPPATDQVPFGGTQQATSSTPAGPSTQPSGSSNSRKASSGSTNDAHMSSATVGVDRPSAAAVPAGVDQVPPSSTAHTASAHTVPQDDSTATDPPTPARKQSMQSVLKDVSDIGQLNQGPSRTPDASEASDAAVGRWQRFKWWIWGTPQQYWTHPDSNKPHSSTSGAAHAAASTTHDGGPSRKRSRWSIADIMASAILRSGITKDDDVARLVGCVCECLHPLRR